MSAQDVLTQIQSEEGFTLETAWRIAGDYLTRLNAAGFTVVPREPTEAMVIAGARCASTADAYRAMIAEGEAAQ